MARTLRDKNPDIVHVHNRPQDWHLVALCSLLALPVTYTVHASFPMTRRQRAVYAACAAAVPALACVSRSVAEHVARTELVSVRKIHVVYNGIALERYAPLAPEARAQKRRELGWGDEFVWLCAARLEEPKGHRFLIEAMTHRPTPRTRLALAGDGSLSADLRARATRLGVDDVARFLGARDDVPALLGAADGYVASSFTEGHPLSLLEAMAAELPVVAPRLPSVVEIAHGDAPLLFGPALPRVAPGHDPRDIARAMQSVEEDPALRERARAARSHVATRFSLAKMLDGYEALYQTVIRGRLGGRVKTGLAPGLALANRLLLGTESDAS